ncbi:MAG: hypothetical protein A2V81_01205 [Candidatus Abawacabacteria bacterium RBG_16_42_10]|uniref:Uncharacterized protein n=1 Tax=Candidatus Abawacabacteria bacterium RBG_16_42_10 TaxID=1817814 RepID=A0A1F4XK66_9BACT|nr:MAG: hypothetical protein A2V81_01205 [Candidatus Abawacabacteria bacterium RBG_16_42_10]
MNSQKLDRKALKIEKSNGFGSNVLRWTRQALLAAGLHVAAFTGANLAIEAGREMTDSNVAHAQTDPREAESRRLFIEGTAAFRGGDFVTARADFLESERIGRELRSVASPEMSWNIALCDMRIAGFEFVSSDTAISETRPINARNESRVEAVLGFSTIAQMRPVRDNLVDARDRMRALVTTYNAQLQEIDASPEPANARERRERAERRSGVVASLRLAREAAAFAERYLGRIESRYHELESVVPSTGDGHTDGTSGRGTGDGRVVVVEGREYVEHREDVWFTTPRAISLVSGITGVAAMAVGGSGYLLNVSDGQTNLSQCRQLQTSGMPCPESLERSFYGASDRAEIFAYTFWAGAAVTAVSTVLILALPTETRVTREPRTTSSVRPRASLFGIPDLTVTPVISDTVTGLTIGGRF